MNADSAYVDTTLPSVQIWLSAGNTLVITRELLPILTSFRLKKLGALCQSQLCFIKTLWNLRKPHEKMIDTSVFQTKINPFICLWRDKELIHLA
jgi:hypothetical protein